MILPVLRYYVPVWKIYTRNSWRNRAVGGGLADNVEQESSRIVIVSQEVHGPEERVGFSCSQFKELLQSKPDQLSFSASNTEETWSA